MTKALHQAWVRAEQTAHAVTKGGYPRSVVEQAQATAAQFAFAFQNRIKGR